MPLLKNLTCATVFALGGFLFASDSAKPNFVIILADDLGYGDVSFTGGSIQTPHLDQLAKEGMRLTDFHSNGPVCTPTRAALMTGRYQQRCGLNGVLMPDATTGLSNKEYTFANALKGVGYTTGIFGKWHLGHLPEFNPTARGFDEFIGLLTGNIDYFTHFKGDQLDWWKGTTSLEEKGNSTTLIVDHSVDFITRHKAEPFCLYVSFNAVHTPIQDPVTGENGKGADTFTKVVQSMDDGAGKVVQALKDNGLADKTLVFFFSDNGSHLGVAGSSSGPLRGSKGDLFEGGHRSPTLAWWPGRIAAGSTSGETAMGIDLMPTMMELAGTTLPPERKIDGISMVPMLQGKELAKRPIFWAMGTRRAMREGPWKLFTDKTETMLFNVEQDLGEKNDLAKQNPEMVTRMQAAVKAWYEDVTTGVVPVKGLPSDKKKDTNKKPSE